MAVDIRHDKTDTFKVGVYLVRRLVRTEAAQTRVQDVNSDSLQYGRLNWSVIL